MNPDDESFIYMEVIRNENIGRRREGEGIYGLHELTELKQIF